MKFKVGDRVIINDYSEAHGDKGIIDTIQKDGLILVELTEYGCIWIVEEHELIKQRRIYAVPS